MRRRLFMETTSIPPERTAAEIQEILRQYGADAIMTEFEDGELRAIQFRLRVGQTKNGISPLVSYKLPCRWEAVMSLLKKKSTRFVTRDKQEEKAKRVAWRQILRWTEAQLALVQTGMAAIEEVFLPFATDSEGRTLFEFVKERGLPQIGYVKPETNGE